MVSASLASGTLKRSTKSRSGIGLHTKRVVTSATAAVTKWAIVHARTAPVTPSCSPTTRTITPTSVSTGGSVWITFHSRTRFSPSRTPQMLCHATWGTSAAAATAATFTPMSAVAAPQATIAAVPATPRISPIANDAWTSGRSWTSCFWARFVTA